MICPSYESSKAHTPSSSPDIDLVSTDTPRPPGGSPAPAMGVGHGRPASAPLRSTLRNTKGHPDQGLCPSSSRLRSPSSGRQCQQNGIICRQLRIGSPQMRCSATRPTSSPLRTLSLPCSVHTFLCLFDHTDPATTRTLTGIPSNLNLRPAHSPSSSTCAFPRPPPPSTGTSAAFALARRRRPWPV
jgi:hypothetical protein